MRNIALNLLLIATVFLTTLFFSACDEGYTINTKEMIREEQELMADYLKTVKDTLTDYSVSVIDSMDEQGYVFFELEEGTGDSVQIGKQVGFRYTYYQIARDSSGVAFMYPYQSNRNSAFPTTYTAGTTNAYNGLYSGLDLAVRFMKFGTKGRVFLSSSLWNNDYTPRAVDIEITYLEK
jgi:hypothetical protein